jgi:hypothetical protein
MRGYTFWNKRLPTILGAFFLLFAVGSIFWMSKNVIDFRGKAAPSETPKQLQISNITQNSFTISYTTDDSVLGTVAYAKDPSTGNVALDDMDKQGGTPAPKKVHYITVPQLDAGTTYYFAIVSGSSNILDNGKPFTVTTGPTLADASSSQLSLTGKVTLPDGNIPSEGVVSASTDTSQLLSVLLQQDGSYTLPLTLLRTKDLTSYASVSAATVLHLQIANSSQSSSVSVLAGQANPVPIITLSNNYDFSVSTNPLSPSAASGSASLSPAASSSALPEPTAGFGSLIQLDASTSGQPAILTPEAAQTFSDQQPVFRGTALPNETIEIVIQSTQKITASIKADPGGNWQYRPTQKLDPGEHTISISTKNTDGILQKIQRTFTVYASGSQFTEPSLTPAITKTPAPTLTPVVVPSPTLTPTASPTATLIPTPTEIPTIAPTASGSGVIVTQPPLPKSGTSTLVLSILGVILAVGVGVVIFLGGIAL